MKYLENISQGSATYKLQQLILGIIRMNKQKTIPAKTMTYLPSIFRMHTNSSSKNISGPSRFSMSLKPLQGTYEGDTYKQASITGNE